MNKIILFLSFCTLLACATTEMKETPMQQIIADYEILVDREEKSKISWGEIHPDSLAKEAAAFKALKDRLTAIPFENLSDADQINADLLTLLLDNNISNFEFETHLFPLDAEGGFIASPVYAMRRAKVEKQEDFDKLMTKLKALPAYFSQRIAYMKEGQRKGKSSPKLVVENGIAIIDELLAKEVDNTFFLTPFKDYPKKGEQVKKVVVEETIPSYKKLREYLQTDYLPKAPEAVGIAATTNGKAYYEQRVRYYTTFDITPKEVFDVGMQEVARIKGEMETIIKELGFKGTFADFLKFLREDPQFYAKTGDELLKEAAWITKKMEGKLPDYFGKLPRMPLTVTPVPEAIAANYTVGRYSPGSYDDHKAGEYWVNTTKLESRPLYSLPALSLHEGVPGHHLQIMLAAEIENMSKFRQRTYLSAYGEGWGLYAEYLGKEAGIYETPYEKFGALTYEMWRACRLVVDPGMHYMGWSREQAVEFMASNTALSFHEVNTEINRYIGWPAQAVSYKMGEIKIKELRKKTEERLGEEFDLRDFHDKILENGSIPLKTLERVIEGFCR